MLTRNLFPSPVFNAADGGGLAAAAAAAAAAGGAQQGQGAADGGAAQGQQGAGGDAGAQGQQGQQGQATAGAASGQQGQAATDFATYVQAFPENLRGANERETLDKVQAHLKDRAPPATADAYKLDRTGELGRIIPENDPGLPIFQKIAHEEGLSPAQFQNVVAKVYSEFGKAGLIQKPIDLNAEFAALSDGKGDKSAQIAEGQRMTVELMGTIKALGERGQLDKDTVAELTGPSLYDAKSTKAIAALVKLATANGGGIVNGGQPGGGQPAPNAEEQQLRSMYPTMKVVA